jgi:hypothetical protein
VHRPLATNCVGWYDRPMKPETDEPDLDRLRTLPAKAVINELLAAWGDDKDVVIAVKRYLPAGTRMDVEALRGWRARGIPRARQTALMRAIADDFGLEVDFDFIERLTADRITAAAVAATQRPGKGQGKRKELPHGRKGSRKAEA